MKPKTKLQKQVAKLSRKLPKLTEKQKAWACKHAVEHVGLRSKSGFITCTECGEKFPDMMKFEDGEIDICPNCGCHLKIETTRKRKDRQIDYFSIITVIKGFQVIRYFYIERNGKAGEKVHYYIQEVVQRFLLPDGNFLTLARLKVMFSSYCYDIWSHGSCLEIRQCDNHDYHFSGEAIYPVRRYIPVLKRNGFKGNFNESSVFDLFRLIITNSKAETLQKARQYNLLGFMSNGNCGKIEYLWPSIKICIRNNYIVKDVTIWKDYLNLLEYFGKDLHNAKYVCPKNLSAEHDRLERKKREKILKDELEKKKNEIAKYEPIYKKSKSKFFGIEFTDGLLHIVVLRSVKEFLEEGTVMHHCVFTNAYYSEPNSLILSARIGDERIETIEVSLKNFTIVQSRGQNNKNTEYHNRIIGLVEKNIGLIKRAKDGKISKKQREQISA